MRVVCPACGVLVKINSEREIALHYPPTDEDEDYSLVCEASGQEYEDENEEE